MLPASLPWSDSQKLRIFSPMALDQRKMRRRSNVSKPSPSKLSRKRQRKTPYYLGLSVLMLLWDWKISVATLLGMGAVWVLPALQRHPWRLTLRHLQPLWIQGNRTFTLSLVGGGLVAMLSYVSIQVWTETQNHWLAAWVVIQGVALVLLTVVGAIFLLKPADSVPGLSGLVTETNAEIRQYLRDLVDAEPMNRLIATHGLMRYLQQAGWEPQTGEMIQDGLTMQLRQETDLTVQSAMLKTLQLLHP